MAKVSPVRSNSESENEEGASGKRNAKTLKAKDVGGSDVDEDMEAKDVEEDTGDGEGEDGSEGEEEEYEIEAILDAKRGTFPEGRIGYFVKWKGYGESENSWVDELDAGNAKVLIDEFWKKHPKSSKVSRKSTDAKTPKKTRKSTVPDSASDAESTSAAQKKRTRKSVTKDEHENGRDDGEPGGARATKKARKGSSARTKAGEATKPLAPHEEPEEVGNMQEYMNVASWEELVATVDTVEREPDKSLTVYFTLKNGERVRENSGLCAERFPQKLINFYETNLRWRSTDDIEAAEGS